MGDTEEGAQRWGDVRRSSGVGSTGGGHHWVVTGEGEGNILGFRDTPRALRAALQLCLAGWEWASPT